MNVGKKFISRMTIIAYFFLVNSSTVTKNIQRIDMINESLFRYCSLGASKLRELPPNPFLGHD